jgi:hypothetical protein
VATPGTAAEANEAVVLRYVEEVWNRHDLDAIDGAELHRPENLLDVAVEARS